MDQVGYAKIATRARAAARPPGPDRDRGRGLGLGLWTWLGMDWIGLDLTRNPYIFGQSIRVPVCWTST